MWVLIAIVVGFFFIKFFLDLNRQSSKVAKEGGMMNKYRELISLIFSEDERLELKRISGSSVLLVLSTIGGTTIFNLTQTFGKLTVQWKMMSPIYGEHKLEWDFDEYVDQSMMFAKMKRDMAKYQQNVLRASGFDKLIP